jgi:bifunctional enzyme CysN/CysC
MVRRLVEPDEFIEVFVDTPIEVCIDRDPKGLYSKARNGQIKNFTGIDAPYQRPERPEVHLHTIAESPGQLAESVLRHLLDQQIVSKEN